ncbi:MAG: DUF3662 and FHA domain-containing protein [Propionibacteriaceae bacterium]|jgi:pSer/pThr/pTyr-binding forkhead associated (FHA) protein|nr:DUF3662 and FHA domain-containing protein [Propionibacteriaceae bacterium]
MGVFGAIEKGIQSAVDWVFRRGAMVEIPEIAQSLQKELDAKAQLIRRDHWTVPNDFRVHLSKADYARLFPLSGAMNQEIAQELRHYADERSYSFPGPIAIGYDERPELPTGRFKVVSRSLAQVVDPAADRAARRGDLVLEVNGIRHPLAPGSFIIGRGNDANVTISDAGISRSHAEIMVRAAAAGPTVHILDLGSRNGVYVNDQRIAPEVEHELRLGDRITLGETQLFVRALSAD